MSEIGRGNSYKPFSVMLRKENAFKFESNGQAYTTTYSEDTANQDPDTRRTIAITNSLESISGPIEEPPSLSTTNNKGQVKKHNVIAENYKVLKLAEQSEFSYTYSVENYKGLYHSMGGVIDQPYKATFSSATGFIADDPVFKLTAEGGDATNTKLVGAVATISGATVTFKKWVQGEAISHSTAYEASSATGESGLLMIRGNELFFDPEYSDGDDNGLPSVAECSGSNLKLSGVTSAAGAEINAIRKIQGDIAGFDNTSETIEIGETATFTTGSAAGIVTNITADTITIDLTSAITSVPQNSALTFSKNTGTTATISNLKVQSVEIFTLAASDDVVDDDADDTAIGSVSSIKYRHLIFGHKAVPHYSGIMQYEALDDSYLMTGMACNSYEINLASNDVPKGSQTWTVAQVDFDDTKETEPTNSDTTLYEYTDISSFILNGADYSDVFKTLSFSVSRDVQVFYGKSKFAKGMVMPEISMSLSAGIVREDKALVNLRIANTELDGKIVLSRGTDDEITFYFDSSNLGASAKLRLLETPESESDGLIFHDLTFDIAGLPVFEVFDATQFYG